MSRPVFTVGHEIAPHPVGVVDSNAVGYKKNKPSESGGLVGIRICYLDTSKTSTRVGKEVEEKSLLLVIHVLKVACGGKGVKRFLFGEYPHITQRSSLGEP